jgi:hypothetical protein
VRGCITVRVLDANMEIPAQERPPRHQTDIGWCHRDEIHMALIQLWDDSFVEGRCPNCDGHVHSARSVRSGEMMPFDNPLTVVRTETLTSSTRAIAVVDGDASMCHLRSCRGRK